MSMDTGRHQRLKYQVFIRHRPASELISRAVRALVEFLESDDFGPQSTPTTTPRTIDVTVPLTPGQARRFDHVLTEYNESSQEVLERAIIAYLVTHDG